MLNIKELEKQFDELLSQISVQQFKEWLAKKEAEEVEIFTTIRHEFSNHGVEMVIEDIYFSDNSWQRIMVLKYQNRSETWDNEDAILDCQKNGFTNKKAFDKYNCLVPHQWFLNNSIPVNKLFDRADLFKSKLT